MKYSITEAAKFLGVDISTLRRWEDAGKIKPERTPGGHRRYDKDMLISLSNKKKNIKFTIAYARVSSADQNEDLQRQIDNISMYCTARGYQFRVISDLGSGLNYTKKGLLELLELICSNEIERIVINYKDRLIRYGYEIIEEVCKHHNVTIEIINNTIDKTYEEELIDDTLNIITEFLSRLYGSRSHKTKKIIDEVKKIINDKEDINDN